MNYLDISSIIRIPKLIDITDESGDYDYELENTCEILTVLYKQEPLGRLLAILHNILRKNSSEIVRNLIDVIDTCNILYNEYLTRRTSSNSSVCKFKFNYLNKEKLKTNLRALLYSTKVNRNLVEDLCANVIEAILNGIKEDITSIILKHSNSTNLIDPNDGDTVMEDSDLNAETCFTEIDKTLSLRFQFEYTDPNININIEKK